MNDFLQSFIFDNHPVRGVIVRLNQTTHTIFEKHAYPKTIQSLLAEALIANVCLFSIAKENGKMTLQFQSQDPAPIKFLSAHCTFDRKLRAFAEWNSNLPEEIEPHSTPLPLPLSDLLGPNACLILTYQSEGLLQPFQSIIPVLPEQRSISQAVESYFTNSDQIKTYLHIISDGQKAGGFMLQALPDATLDSTIAQEESFTHLATLAKTVTPNELFTDSPEELLFKLFHQEKARIFEPRPLAFGCTCTKEKMENAVRSLGPKEIEKILEEKSYIEVNCQFCNQKYQWTPDETK